MKGEISAIGKMLAVVAVLSYVAAMILEWWRPGFVTFFWNPQILLIIAIFGAILGACGTSPKE